MFREAPLIPTPRHKKIGRPMRRKSSVRRLDAELLAVVLAVVAVGILATAMSAQERPNFTGAWTVSEQQAAPATESDGSTVSLGSGWGDSFVLVQDSGVLTVERVLYRPRDYQPTLKLRYSLDGSESQNVFVMGRGMQVQDSIARWEGDTLVITMVHPLPEVGEGQPVGCEVTQTLSLEPPQQAVGESSLLIETTRCGVLGGLPSTTRTVYSRN